MSLPLDFPACLPRHYCAGLSHLPLLDGCRVARDWLPQREYADSSPATGSSTQVGEDAAAEEYHSRLVEAGVEPLLAKSTSGLRTAESLSVVSDDGQRTMRPYLGAAKIRYTPVLGHAGSGADSGGPAGACAGRLQTPF
eukprot:1184032-Prorocentrum_minimum.AAC.1